MTTQVRPQLRRRLALAGALAALAVPALSACSSFDYATDRPNVIANGGYDLDSPVRVNAARIVTAQQGSGIFIATFTANPTVGAADDSAKNPSITGVAAASDAQQDVTAAGPVDIKIGNSGVANLADPATGGVPVTGDFVPGDIVPITLQFSKGDPVTVQVPVVTQCGPYADVVAQSGNQSGQGKKAGKGASGTEPSASTSASTSSTESTSTTSQSTGDTVTDPYSCNYPKAELPSE